MKATARATVVRLVKVPPFSVLVVNSDTFPAGSTWRDANSAFTCEADTVRYHVHLVKARCSLTDDIHSLPDFIPRCPQPPCTSQVDLDPLMDAVRGQYRVVAEVSTESPAAMRRSNEPKLGSPAALMQQVDGVISTRRAACSSRKKQKSRKINHSFS